MIVIYHFNGTIYDGNIEILNINYILASGVDLFFIISGFLMFDLIEKKRYSFKEFLFKRLYKIVPIYFSVTIFLFLMERIFNIFPLKEIMFTDLIRALTFSNIIFGNKDLILSVGWTLEYEVIFYIFVSLIILLNLSIRNSVIFISSLLILTSILLNNFLFVEFLYGGLAYYFLKNKLYKNYKVVLLGLIISILCLVIIKSRFISFGLPMFFIFLISFSINNVNYKISNLKINISYEIYIFHHLIIKVLERVGILNKLPYLLGLTFTFLIVFLISYISNKIERNFKKVFLPSP